MQTPDQHVRPDAQRARAARQLVGARVQLARRSALVSPNCTATASGRPRRPAPRSARAGRARAGRRAAVSFHSTSDLLPLGSVSSGSSPTAPAPARAAPREQRLEVPGHARDRGRVEQVGVVLPVDRRARRRSRRPAASRSNLRRPVIGSPSGSQRPARGCAGALVAWPFCRANITWNSGEWLRLRARAAAPRPAARTAGPGARTRRGATSRTRCSSSREGRLARTGRSAAPAC